MKMVLSQDEIVEALKAYLAKRGLKIVSVETIITIDHRDMQKATLRAECEFEVLGTEQH